ncbi:MAG TPA: SDR family NAD(P)-dependent oxidoreductase [Thermoanaerobaculia bacterium]|nr:SDR family NAD(P)-dependent oxidoreductase [Thermoanaerobaculia bacterium]
MSLAGKVAIVTGAASGIGAACVERLAADGARVCGSDLQPAANIVACDVTSEDAMRDLVDRTVAKYGRLDIMVNNAGIGESSIPIDEKPAAKWQKIIDTNLTSVFYGLKHAARAMKRQGTGGVIINMSSILGSVGMTGAPAYVAAKHGVIGLTKEAALELAASKIRVVAVQPAFIKTPLIKGMEASVLPLHPIGRLGEASEVAALVAFLASDEAGFVTGAGYLIDGGYTAQ